MIEVPNAIEEDDLETQEMDDARERFNQAVSNLMVSRGISRGKATKILDKKCQKELDKLVKKGKKRQDKLRVEGKLIDTSDIKEELDKEFQDQLKAEGIVLDGVSTDYEPPTREF